MKFDAIIIGTGQAGTPLAASLAENGQKVAIIEKGDFGGTCVNTGCTPTKAYVASARRAFITKNSQEHGVTIDGEVKVNLRAIKRRKDQLVQKSSEGIKKMLEDNKNIQVFRGEAKFKDDHTVTVDNNTLQGEKIYINTGSRPNIPAPYKNLNYYTNKTMLELEEIPEHLVVIGGGYVGLEFAQMFRRFGSKVSILDRGDRLMKQEDADVSEAILQILKDEDIQVYLNSEDIKGSQGQNSVNFSFNVNGAEKNINGSHLLLATGRVPNTANIGLENTSVDLDKKGYIKVNEELQTSVPHIYALGDCNGEGAFTHTSYNDFEIVESNLLQHKKRSLLERIPCYAAFIDPPLARVGMNEAEIKEKGIKAKLASRPMGKVARAQEMGETSGMMKIYIEAETDKILGATFLGTGADEVIHAVIDAMYAGTPYTTIRDAVHIHPTVSELIPTMLETPEDLE
ncbi:FAD-containing oxidoreductase [Salegentibacter sp. F188]|uniref:FAD-containing oxidoreductase n=1 Tax=Autumnicola patrickiae TaxID=3075591 RepID=A0ABU3E5A7_9FLAO|nr:FAD-containing oxidoreductase [Salegentibacter sp. F188]MDT0690824.1 FAD-containing oxidoreductase [Salegentibacter sp. F188]